MVSEETDSWVVADQLRAIDAYRLLKRLGKLPDTMLIVFFRGLQAMFSV